MSALPKPPKEVPRETALDKLAPGFVRKVHALLDAMKKAGHQAYIGESWRTDARQQFLFGFGRKYDDGRGVVTKASSADTTMHAYGLAVDIWDAANPAAPWQPKNPTAFRAELQKQCKALGLRWGADWNHNGSTADERFVDWPHVQELAAPRTPTSRDQQDRKTGNLRAVWSRYGVAA